jgi:sulfur-oxidizing protein SoxZ
MSAPRIRVSVPATAARGSTVEIKTLIDHPMESGLRRDLDGKPIPRKILNRFVCRYNGEVVVDCDWHTAVAASPFLAFYAVASESGAFEFEWTDDDGTVHRASAPIRVT